MVVIQMRWANPLLYLVCCFVVVVYSFVIYWILLWTLSHVRWMHIFYLHSMGFSIDIVKIYINLSFAFYHMLLLLCEVTFTIYPLRFRFFPSLFCYVYPLSIILWLDSHLFLSLVLSQPSSFSSKAWHAWLICAQYSSCESFWHCFVYSESVNAWSSCRSSKILVTLPSLTGLYWRHMQTLCNYI